MCTYYHTGTAVKAAEYEGRDFWDYLLEYYPIAPRGSQRRHFRGDMGLRALEKMRKLHADPGTWFEAFPQTYKGVKEQCEELLQFGSYFVLKVCDYMDRCLTLPIKDWSGLEKNLPTEPAKALKILSPDGGFMGLVDHLSKHEILAAPLFDRLVGPAEVETILCDWYGAKMGKNWFGLDTRAKRADLKGYGKRADEMITFFPPIFPEDTFQLKLV